MTNNPQPLSLLVPSNRHVTEATRLHFFAHKICSDSSKRDLATHGWHSLPCVRRLSPKAFKISRSHEGERERDPTNGSSLYVSDVVGKLKEEPLQASPTPPTRGKGKGKGSTSSGQCLDSRKKNREEKMKTEEKRTGWERRDLLSFFSVPFLFLSVSFSFQCVFHSLNL